MFLPQLILQMIGVVGMSMMYLIGPYINWRILALIGTFPTLLQLPLIFFIPESPRWLIGIWLTVLQHLGEANAYAYYSGVIFVSAGLSKYIGLGTLAVVEIPVYITEVTTRNIQGGFTSVHQELRLMQLLGLVFVPESPRWLAKIGKCKECEAALQCLKGNNADISDYGEQVQLLSEASIFEICSVPHCKN
ncbi:hypothetical protein REPUB_Repub16aG0132000 [Reevesia pubescens]